MVLTLGLLYFSVFINADDLDDQVRFIAHQLRCPTCQALSVKESEAGLSVNMKLKIREMLQAGKSEKEILLFFEKRYGEWILRSPKKEGFNLLLWILPAVIILVSILLLFRVLKKRSYQTKTEDITPLSAEEKAKIENDLQHL